MDLVDCYNVSLSESIEFYAEGTNIALITTFNNGIDAITESQGCDDPTTTASYLLGMVPIVNLLSSDIIIPHIPVLLEGGVDNRERSCNYHLYDNYEAHLSNHPWQQFIANAQHRKFDDITHQQVVTCISTIDVNIPDEVWKCALVGYAIDDLNFTGPLLQLLIELLGGVECD